MEKNFHNRLASNADFEGVMDIDRNVYDGNDYLAHFWQDWIIDNNRVNIVIETGDNEIIDAVF